MLFCLLFPLVAEAIVWRGDVAAIETKASGEMKQVGKVYYSPLKVFGGSCLAMGDDWVLTSKHGTDKWAASWLQVRFPALGKKTYKVERIVLCPNADFALLKLKEAVPGAKPISLYKGDDEVGKRAWIGGFGKSGPVGTVGASGTFHEGHNKIEKLRGGKLSLKMSKPGDESIEKDEATVARMDSGSPLFIQHKGQWKVAGIASSASNGVNPGYGDRGNYARVSKITDWIDTTIKTKPSEP